MNDIQVFTSADYGEVRTILINNEPWFAASDVCKSLEIGNPSQALTRLDDDEKTTTLISNESAATGVSQLSLVSQSGLYSLVLGSRKPEAKAFKRWITHDVIPSIQKTGSYSMIDRQKLSPNTQALYALADSIAVLEIRQNEQSERISVLETRQNAIGEAVRPISSENWRKDVYKKFMRIQIASGIDHESLYTEVYTELDRRAGINLKARLRNMRERLRSEGASNTKLKNINYMDVIVLDKKLREILEKILTEYELKYCA